eukprot:gene8365-14339_t
MLRLGKITRTIKWFGGKTQGAELQTMTNGRAMVIERPVQLLYPMEINAHKDAITPEEGFASDDRTHTRPRRNAARQAHDVMKTQLVLEDEEKLLVK